MQPPPLHFFVLQTERRQPFQSLSSQFSEFTRLSLGFCSYAEAWPSLFFVECLVMIGLNFFFLPFSKGSQYCAVCCSKSKNTCLEDIKQFSSYLQQEGNLNPLTPSQSEAKCSELCYCILVFDDNFHLQNCGWYSGFPENVQALLILGSRGQISLKFIRKSIRKEI